MIGLTGRLIFMGVLCIILFSISLYFFNYIPDDTFITLRYARNAIRGYGLVFNRFDRLEGYSNFLWLILLIAAGKAQLPLILSARALSLLLTFVSIFLTAVYAARLSRPYRSTGNKALIIGMPAIAMAASSAVSTWSLSGTEIPLFTTMLLLSAIALIDGKKYLSLSLAATLGLIRPEGIVFFALFLFLIADESRESGKALLVGIAIAAALYLPYLAWKVNYFGSIIPNTYYAKRGPLPLTAGNGSKYLLKFIMSYGYMMLIALFLLGGYLKRERAILIATSLVITHWALIVLLGGDWMPNFRLLLPTLPFIFIILSVSLVGKLSGVAPGSASDRTDSDTSIKAGEREIAPLAGALMVILITVLSIAPGFIHYENFKTERITVRAFVHVGRKLKEILPPNTTIACGSTGAIGYFTDLPIVDILGLTDRHIARQGRIVSDQPGHLKTDGRYILNRKPALLLFGNIMIHRGILSEKEMKIKIQESEVTSLPQFRGLYEYINLPIGYGFYLSCYKRRDFFLPVESNG